MTICTLPVEICHTDPCAGVDELVSLMPKGMMWDLNNELIFSELFKCVGQLKSDLNAAICQEFCEVDPCKAERYLQYWIEFYKLPSCVEQTSEKLCEWIDLLFGDCPIGTQGFITRAIEFVSPGNEIDVQFDSTYEGESGPTGDNLFCPDSNPIVITAPPSYFQYEERVFDFPHDALDGVNHCRYYFIPEIECLRECWFPFGMGIGYRTDPPGPNGEYIYGVDESAVGVSNINDCSCYG